MRTFRSLLKSKLKELGYPVEISRLCPNGRIKYLSRRVIDKKGIRIERDSYPEYTDRHSGRYYEDITITTNGYIELSEIEKIVEKLKKGYGNRLLSVHLYEDRY